MEDEELVRLFLLETTQAMVDHPVAVRVETAGTGQRTQLRLHVHSSDLGKVIGKQGRTARALRTIVGGIAAKTGTSFTLDIAEDDDVSR